MARFVRLVVAALALCPTVATAQTGGPDPFGYSYAPTTYDFVPIAALGTNLAATDDSSAAVTLPWAFPFYGASYSTANVGSNGGIGFAAAMTTFSNANFPTTTASHPDIAPFWDDMNPANGGGVYTFSDTANGRYIVSWEGVPHYSNVGAASFQVHLYPSGLIEFHWSDVDFGDATLNNGASATIGIQNRSGGNSVSANNYLRVSFNTAQAWLTGSAIAFTTCVDVDGDSVLSDTCGGTDCDDADPDNFPGNPEACDGQDNDCDPGTDETVDNDGDTLSACDGDCDDGDVLNFPGNAELCDGLDNDCNGLPDADVAGEIDNDADTGLSCDDCDDADPLRFAGNPEVCDTLDNDCDGVVPADETTDTDLDGFALCADCDDEDDTIFPGAVETCDGVDENCDGQLVDVYTSAPGTTNGTLTGAYRGGKFQASTDATLASFAGRVNAVAGQTLTFNVYEGASATGTFALLGGGTITAPGGGMQWIESPPLDLALTGGMYYALVYAWSGSTGYTYSTGVFPRTLSWGTHIAGLAGSGVPAGGSTISSSTLDYEIRVHSNAEVDADGDLALACAECDDQDANVYPGAPELCDGVDDDCDGLLGNGEGDPDGDGSLECVDDCDDNDAAVYPGAPELCNGQDDDCDSVVPAIELDDLDSDGAIACADCDDADSTRYPGAFEACDSADSDCDGLSDDVDPDVGGIGSLIEVDAAPALPLPDLTATTTTLTVSGASATVFDVNVALDITHTWDEDLDISLTSPLGTTVILSNDHGGSGDNYTDTVFDDEAATPVASGAAPFTGSFQPDGDLSDFDGEDPNGVWTLTIYDDVSSDVGTLNDWGLSIGVGAAADGDGDGVTFCGECDDNDATTYPGAPEICDGADNDCDTVVPPDEAVDDDGDGAFLCADCDDAVPSSYPGAPELCNGVDDDCDGGTSDTYGPPQGQTSTTTGSLFRGGKVLMSTSTVLTQIEADLNAPVGTALNWAVYSGATANGSYTRIATNTTTSTVLGRGWHSSGAISVPLVAGTYYVIGVQFSATLTYYYGSLTGLPYTVPFGSYLGGAATSGTTPPLSATFGASSTGYNVRASIENELDGDGDSYLGCDDCNDGEASIHPFAAEICGDAIDQDCDGFDAQAGDFDADGVDACNGDCNDQDATIYPGATEVCDGADTDCDGNLPPDEVDADGDGSPLCEPDCDDLDPARFPGNVEACDGEDNDCDGVVPVDEIDGDSDGAIECDGDCAPADPAIPAATELCDGLDGDCDGVVPANEADTDGDGQRVCAGDCDDAEPLAQAGGVEVCDGIDNDCVGGADFGGVPEVDADGDGAFGCGADCDDGDSDNFPSNPEVCDGADNDCNGSADADAGGEVDSDGDGSLSCFDCDDTSADVLPGHVELCDTLDNDCDPATSELLDGDGDGWSVCEDDCDDLDAAIGPDAEEICDGLDNDCDPATDEAIDGDGDGETICDGDCDDDDPGSSTAATEICDGADNDCDGALLPEEADGDGDGSIGCDDCNDADATIHPGAAEQCNGIDDDCDGGSLDEETGDADADTVTPCEGDCDDTAAAVYPGADEGCDGIDTDCDGAPGADEADADGDGVATCAGDCDEGSSDISPDAAEVCDDEVDNDCDLDVDGADADCAAGDDDDDTDDGTGGCDGCEQGGDATFLPLLAAPLLLRRRRARR